MLNQVFYVKVNQLDAFAREYAQLALQLRTLVVFKFQFFEQSLFDPPGLFLSTHTGDDSSICRLAVRQKPYVQDFIRLLAFLLNLLKKIIHYF